MTLTDTGSFGLFSGLGYVDLIPVIPPRAAISDRSSIARLVDTPNDPRGKAPGVKGRDGEWRSYDWRHGVATHEDFERWHAMGASVGLRCGAVLAIDIDTLDPVRADGVAKIAERHFGALAARFGKAPKRVVLVRAADPSAPPPYMRVEFETTQERVEVLSVGRQVVIAGEHPKTGKPYAWTPAPPSFDSLPRVTEADITAFLLEVRETFRGGELQRSHDPNAPSVNQETLKAPLDYVRRIVELLPNDERTAPGRNEWIEVGYAIKGATLDDPDEGLALWQDWSARWNGGDNDPDLTTAEWFKMKTPVRLGIGKLVEMAERTATDQQAVFAATVDRWFGDTTAEPAPERPKADLYAMATLDELWQRPPPVFLVARHIPVVGVGFLYAAPGAGKTFLALDLALTLAYGLPDWHGDAVAYAEDRGGLAGGVGMPVVYVAAEGGFDLGLRCLAWAEKRGVGAPTPNFRAIEQTINFMDRDDVAKLVRTVASLGVAPALVVVDTVSRAMPGADENLQKDMTLFIAACDRVRDVFGCAVLGLHHTSKDGGMRGSTVIPGGADFIFELEREKGEEVGHLTCAKMKAGPDGWSDRYALRGYTTAKGTSLVPERLAPAVQEVASATGAAAVLSAMQAAWDRGEPWGAVPRALDNYAAQRMRRSFPDLFREVKDAERALDMWAKAGVIVVEIVDRKSKRRGYKVVPGKAHEADNLSGGDSVFD